MKCLILALVILFQFGCATRPVFEDRKELYFSKEKLGSQIVGKILIESDKTSIFEDKSSAKRSVESGLYYYGSEYIEQENGITYSFTFNKCAEVGMYPTDRLYLNILISVGTLTIFPIGKKFKCSAKLSVTNNNLGNTKVYEQELSGYNGGGFFSVFDLGVWGGDFELREVFTQKLFKQYVDDLPKQ